MTTIPQTTPIAALFCGSRHWTDAAAIAADVDALPPDSIVIHGGAPGADTLAAQAAQARGLHVARVDALWRRYGRSAGPRRNRAMLLLHPDVVYAYPQGGPGTAGMMALARERGIPVLVRTTSSPGRRR